MIGLCVRTSRCPECPLSFWSAVTSRLSDPDPLSVPFRSQLSFVKTSAFFALSGNDLARILRVREGYPALLHEHIARKQDLARRELPLTLIPRVDLRYQVRGV